MRCTIWYNLHNLKNVKNTQGGVSLLVILQAEAWSINYFSNPWIKMSFTIHLNINLLLKLFDKFHHLINKLNLHLDILAIVELRIKNLGLAP